MAITSSKISLVFSFSAGDRYIYSTVIAYYTGFMYRFSYLFNKIYIRDTHTHTERERGEGGDPRSENQRWAIKQAKQGRQSKENAGISIQS